MALMSGRHLLRRQGQCRRGSVNQLWDQLLDANDFRCRDNEVYGVVIYSMIEYALRIQKAPAVTGSLFIYLTFLRYHKKASKTFFRCKHPPRSPSSAPCVPKHPARSRSIHLNRYRILHLVANVFDFWNVALPHAAARSPLLRTGSAKKARHAM